MCEAELSEVLPFRANEVGKSKIEPIEVQWVSPITHSGNTGVLD
jgi:hypothetical protein